MSPAVTNRAIFPADIDWKTRTSENFSVLYAKGQDDLAIKTLKAAERAHRLLTPIFPDAPDHTWVVLGQFQDVTNGYALTWPYPHMVIFAAPAGIVVGAFFLG